MVGPAPHFGGPGGAPPVLAAVPCQPLPLQPFEWFNPTFFPYVTAPCHNGLASARDRRKRYSTDSQVLHIRSLLLSHEMARNLLGNKYGTHRIASALFQGLHSICSNSDTWIGLFVGGIHSLTHSCVQATNLRNLNGCG